jgi:transposase-like protein
VTMPHDELLALVAEAYRFAGVPDPDRLAAAFAARRGGTVTVVPPCPRCRAASAVWLGGVPDGGDHWRCADCGHDWTTPPA